jgi:hypothetical protein
MLIDPHDLSTRMIEINYPSTSPNRIGIDWPTPTPTATPLSSETEDQSSQVQNFYSAASPPASPLIVSRTLGT